MPSNAVAGFSPGVHGFRFANAFPPGPTVTLGPLDPRVVGIGDASAGLCGGMVLTVRDLFEAGVAPPPDTTPPANGSPRFRSIVRRQVQSLDWLRVPLRYFSLQAFRPDPPTGISRLLRRDPARIVAVRDEWPRIRAEIEAGRLAVIGLIRTSSAAPWSLSRNHQVLGYAYELSGGGFRIRIYDPNHPGDDSVELVAAPTGETDPAGTGPVASERATDPRDAPEEGGPGDGGAPAGSPPLDRLRLRQSTGETLVGFFLQPYPPPSTMAAWR